MNVHAFRAALCVAQAEDLQREGILSVVPSFEEFYSLSVTNMAHMIPTENEVGWKKLSQYKARAHVILKNRKA